MSVLEQDMPSYQCSACGYDRRDDGNGPCPNPHCPSNQESGPEGQGEPEPVDAKAWARAQKKAIAALNDLEPPASFTLTATTDQGEKTISSPGGEEAAAPDIAALKRPVRAAATAARAAGDGPGPPMAGFSTFLAKACAAERSTRKGIHTQCGQRPRGRSASGF